MTRDGIVYLVGAGPGDPGLLTLRGGELLVTADAVVYDALTNPALLSLAAVGDRPVEFHDAGKRGGDKHSATQDAINELLIRLAGEGKRVVRLKGGDPFVFGRGSEEAQALAKAGVRFEVVPGVTAGISAPAYAGIPVTHRGLSTSVTFVTGHEDPGKQPSVDWHALARAGGTLVLYMSVKTLPAIVASLVAGGRSPDTPAASVQWGTYPHQRTLITTLGRLTGDIASSGLTAPIITIIGDVVSLREQIAWFDKRPLFGKRIVVTRAQAQAASLTGKLTDRGAQVLEMPATRIEVTDPATTRAMIDRLNEYDWAMFTSQNAVRVFWDALRASGRDTRALAGVKIAAVGPATADALLEHGVTVDVEPQRFVAEALLDALENRDDVRGSRVLYAAAEGARDVLPAGLERLGAKVDRVTLYRSASDGTGADSLREALMSGAVDLITFTSASAVRSFINAVGDEAAHRAPVASIGPITTAAARESGLDVSIEATTSTIQGLVDAICDAMTGASQPA